MRAQRAISAVVLVAFVTSNAPWVARADTSEPSAGAPVSREAAERFEPAVDHGAAAAARLERHLRDESAGERLAPDAVVGRPDPGLAEPGSLSASDVAGVSAVVTAPPNDASKSLPTGPGQSGVSSQSISVPQGSGKIDGMGESFSTQLSTGIASLTLPFALPAGRGGAQPSLGLTYSSAGGSGLAGLGWELGTPFIQRQTDRGIPRYEDPAEGGPWHPEQDRFVFDGGQELVPICLVTAELGCEGALPGEVMPPWSAGHQYFRLRVEGSFQRFFWAPNHLTWRIQDKSGMTMELGVPLDGSGDRSALEVNPTDPNQIFRWRLVRQYDTYGTANPSSGNPQPVNVTLFKYFSDGERAYLSDVFYTTPRSNATTSNTQLFAHHVRLAYEPRTDPTVSYRSGWAMEQRLRLSRVDISSRPFNAGTGDPRRLVRRYHLSYDPAWHSSLLARVVVEGRCAGSELAAPAEDGAGLLPDDTGCAELPAMTFDYTHAPGTSTLPGFEAMVGSVGETDVQRIYGSPKYAIDEELTDLFDIDSDSLPDVLVTAPALFGGKHGLFLNGPAAGAVPTESPMPQGFKSSTIGLAPNPDLPGIDANILRLGNQNVAPLDLDGDGTIDLVHMPRVKKYSIFTPTAAAGAFTWTGRPVTTASGQDAKIDFTNDNAKIRVLDVDNDGLVDAVVTTGTEVQTFFALGRYPGGDGQFGHARWTGAASASLSNDPITTCLPWSATPIQFGDPDVHLADMNGDGLTDIVRLRPGDVRYWPGRGNGFWGTGRKDDCPARTFGQNRHVTMASAPNFGVVQSESRLLLDDVNGDGLADVVEIRYDDIDVYLNVSGTGFTPRHVVRDAPPAAPSSDRVRLVDMNGSGTRDVVWGNGRDYKFIDLHGGVQPGLLARIENGLGKSTDIEYTTSTAEMLTAEAYGGSCGNPNRLWLSPWCSKMPIVAHLVKRVTESDNLTVAGKPPSRHVTEYDYRDPVYEGRQREFRGFRKARIRRIGDENSPTDITESTFLLGECSDETPGNGVDECAVSERWRDNPREALKGLPILTEQYDEHGTYLSTEAMSYRLRRLYVGLDGREVRHAFESGNRKYLYDTAAPSAGSTASFDAVELELELDSAWQPLTDPEAPASGVQSGGTISVPIRHSAGHAVIEAASVVDYFGNRLVAINRGCVSGPACSTPDERIYSFTEAGLPAGERTGWLFRTTRSWVTGSQDTTRRKESLTTYNPEGDPILTRAVLQGTVALERFRSSGSGPVAGPPVGASVDADASNPLFVSSRTYDERGLLVQEQAANGRCRQVGYETDVYGYLPTLEQIFRNGCGNAPLVTSAMYDRGFGLVTTGVDMRGQSTFVDYDEFGRLSELRRPDPSGDTPKESRLPSVRISYFLAGTSGLANRSVIRTEVQDGDTPAASEYSISYAYVDGLGRTIVTLAEADTTAGDEAPWIVSDLKEYDDKLAVRRSYLPSYTSADPLSYPIELQPDAPYGRQRYDAFGRALQTFDIDGTVTLERRYHALENDVYDAADLQSGPHQGTYASARSDGHGRAIVSTERIRVDGAIEQRQVRTSYLPTGEPRVITRVRVGSADPPVVRWMRYDSLGRLVLNVDPHTSANYSPEPDTNPVPGPGGIKAWRYAYNDFGDLVGTSDARGCGVNFFYDGVGRLIGEDYSPCEAHHASYTAASTADLATGENLEVFYVFDDAVAPGFPSGFSPPPGYPTPPSAAAQLLTGRVVAVFDRAAATFTRYDARGRVTGTDVRIYRTNASATAPFGGTETRYASEWFGKDFAYDAADREVASTTGSTVANLQGQALTQYGFPAARDSSVVTTSYTRRGLVKSVSGSFQSLVASIDRTADGLAQEIVYGDVAGTTTSFRYDNRRRLSSVQTYRGPPPLWSSPPGDYTPAPAPAGTATSFQLLLQDEDIVYDVANNPTEIRDWRSAAEWPVGAKPVTKKVSYDDLYRVVRVSYEHSGGADFWVDPFAAEAGAEASDPRRAPPSPRLSFPGRVRWQSFEYDWLGNTALSDDDASGFYDRSLGTITTNVASQKPYQLDTATNKPGGLGSSGNPPPNGELRTVYDVAGHLVRLDLERNGTCIGGQCSQRYAYRWDEVGRLVRALRWDVSYAPGASLPSDDSAAADLSYLYDASDERVLKIAEVPGPNLHTLYVFDSLELRRATLDGTGAAANYTRNDSTEVPYLFANGVRLARVVLEGTADGEPRVGSGVSSRLHVFLELGDHLGSTSTVLDKATSELVERSTYQAHGGADSDYRPDRWQGFREDYRFSGKEEDVEVGLQYFGKRFLNPQLGRWLSPDPLAVHAPGEADLNLYSYVGGLLYAASDPDGLDPQAYYKARAMAEQVQNYVGPKIQKAREFASGMLKSTVNNATDTVADVMGGLAMVVGGSGIFANPAQTRAHRMNTLRDIERAREELHLPLKTEAEKAGGTTVDVIGIIGAIAGVTKFSARALIRKLPKNPPLCFAAGTLVQTADGKRPIEDIGEGDQVLAKNEVTGEIAWQPVSGVIQTEDARVLRVQIAGEPEDLIVTHEHPFWVEGRGWTEARELSAGDELFGADGRSLRVLAVVDRGEKTTVYNLSVANFRTYFVGESGVWVHNDWCALIGKMGEDITRQSLTKTGDFRRVTSLQNSKNQGLDVVAQLKDGSWTFGEVKSSATPGQMPALSKEQAEGAQKYVWNQLQAFAFEGKGTKEQAELAKQILSDLGSPENIKGHVFEVNLDSGAASVRPWVPEPTK